MDADRPRQSHPWRAPFGLEVGKVSTGQFEAQVWELIDEGDGQIRWVVGTYALGPRREEDGEVVRGWI